MLNFAELIATTHARKGLHTLDAIWQSDTPFRFSLTDNIDPDRRSSDIYKRYNILSYLVCIYFKNSFNRRCYTSKM